MSNIEQTLSIIKPDAVERNLENVIKEMFIQKGFTIFNLLFKKYCLIFSVKFLSTASGFIIDRVCSTLLIIFFNELI